MQRGEMGDLPMNADSSKRGKNVNKRIFGISMKEATDA